MYARDSEISVSLNKGFIYSIYRPPALQNIYKYTNDNIIHLLTKKKKTTTTTKQNIFLQAWSKKLTQIVQMELSEKRNN